MPVPDQVRDDGSGIQNMLKLLDSGFHRNDALKTFLTFATLSSISLDQTAPLFGQWRRLYLLLIHLIAVYDFQLAPFRCILKGQGAVIVVSQEIISVTVGVGMFVHRQIL